MTTELGLDNLSGSGGGSGGGSGDGSDGSGGGSTSASGEEGKRKKRAVKTCGTIDGIPVECAGDGGNSLDEPPAEDTVVSNSVVFENKFIDIFAGVEPLVREVHSA